jgi:hypothetical protein
MHGYAGQIARVLKAVVLIFAICSTIAFSIHPIRAHSYKSTVADGHYAPSTSSSSGTSVFVSPPLLGNASLTPGMNVTVSVFINNVANLDAWEFKVKVDTSILKAVDADGTPYWDTQQAQGKGSYLVRVNATAGTDFVYWVSYRQPNGVIPSLTTTVPFQLGIAKFQVLTSTKDTPFHIVTSQEDPNYGTILIDTNLNYIGYQSTDGAFANVRAPWDINWDLKVDIADLALVARSFGTTPGASGWNITADVNGDGRVDIADLTLVASHFGQNI